MPSLEPHECVYVFVLMKCTIYNPFGTVVDANGPVLSVRRFWISMIWKEID